MWPLLPLRFLLLVALVIIFFLGSVHGRELKVGFYKDSCPDAEAIVRKVVAAAVADDPTATAPLLRLHFHDCFVRGCDGSVLINSTKRKEAEKDARPNRTLGGFDVIDAAKEALEKKCPGTVSCADITAIAARDAVSLATAAVRKRKWGKDGNFYDVETGRRDGRVSVAKEAVKNLPSSFDGIRRLKKRFHSKGLSLKDLAILSGAHAIGFSHCFSLARRLHNFTTKLDTDPTLDASYATKLRKECKPGDNTTELEMVPGSSTTFDATYYKLVAANKGLFHSDAALLRNRVTRKYVRRFAKSERSFFHHFGVSMVAMGRVGVLTGREGEIRRKCALVNSH